MKFHYRQKDELQKHTLVCLFFSFLVVRYCSPLKKGGCNTHAEELRSKGQSHLNQKFGLKIYQKNENLRHFAVVKVAVGLAELRGLDLRP